MAGFQGEETMVEYHADQNYAKNLASSLNDYRKNKVICDVILVIPPKEYFAHRNVLCASSPYLLECLTTGTTHTTLGSRLEITNISPKTMEDVLNFMYIGEICVSEENVEKLISASDILKMKNLKELTCRYYEKRLNASNCLSIASLADKFNCDTLRTAADQFILQNFLDVSNYKEFKVLSCTHVISLLSSDDINVHREEQIYEIARKWIDYDSENRNIYLATLLGCVRLLQTSKYFIADVLEKEEDIMSDPNCCLIINEAKLILDFPDRKHLIMYKNSFEPRKFSDIMHVLIVCGGNQERMSSNEVLCYVPTQDFWYPLAPLIHSRFGSFSVVLNNEMICLGGKTEEKFSRHVEKYSFGLDRWVESVPLPSPTSGHVACVFNGEIYVIGGGEKDESSARVIKYSNVNNKWLHLRDMKIPRRSAAVAVHKCLYVIGGYDNQGLSLASVERYNPYLDEWSKIFPMNSARASASATCIGNNIFVFGGEYAMWSYYRSAEVFDIESDEWKNITDMSVPRGHMGITVLRDEIYLVGGMVSAEGTDQYGVDEEDDFVDVNETNLVECYNICSKSWRKICSLPVHTASPNCAVLSVSKSVLENRFGFQFHG